MKLFIILTGNLVLTCMGANSTLSVSVTTVAAGTGNLSTNTTCASPPDGPPRFLEILTVTTNVNEPSPKIPEAVTTLPSISTTNAASTPNTAPADPGASLDRSQNLEPPAMATSVSNSPLTTAELLILTILKTLEGHTTTTNVSPQPSAITEVSMDPYLSTSNAISHATVTTNDSADSLVSAQSVEIVTRTTSPTSNAISHATVTTSDPAVTLASVQSVEVITRTTSAISPTLAISAAPLIITLMTTLQSLEDVTVMTWSSSTSSLEAKITLMHAPPSIQDAVPHLTANATTILYPKVPEYLITDSYCSIVTTSCQSASLEGLFTWAFDSATTCFQCKPALAFSTSPSTLPSENIVRASYVEYLTSFVSSVAVDNVPITSVDVVLLSKISIWTIGLPAPSSTATNPS